MTEPTPTMTQRMDAGEWYIAGDEEFLARKARTMPLQEAYNATTADQGDERTRLLGELLGSVGEEVEILPPFHVDYGDKISIGARSFANFGLTALDVAPITIGEDCLFGPNVQLLTPTHPIAPTPRREKWEGAAPITVEDNVWIGGGAIVCPGVTIGENSVIGAGSVVTKDVPANVIAVGNPCRVLREITAEELAERSPQV